MKGEGEDRHGSGPTVAFMYLLTQLLPYLHPLWPLAAAYDLHCQQQICCTHPSRVQLGCHRDQHCYNKKGGAPAGMVGGNVDLCISVSALSAHLVLPVILGEGSATFCIHRGRLTACSHIIIHLLLQFWSPAWCLTGYAWPLPPLFV
jgi:hypothetical protein